MGILSKEIILDRMHEKKLCDRLVISPLLSEGQVGPSTVDIRLSNEFLIPKRSNASIFDSMNREEMDLMVGALEKEFVPFSEKFFLHPNKVILAGTLEYFRMPNDLTARVTARSSYERLGLKAHTIAQPGYCGALTLTLINLGNTPIVLYPGLRIAQMTIFKLEHRKKLPAYAGKYKNEVGPKFSRAHLDEELEKLNELKELLT